MTHAAGRWLGIVWHLLGATRRRLRARRREQEKRVRAGAPGVLYAISLFNILVLQILLANAFLSVSEIADELAIEATGKAQVSSTLYERLQEYEKQRENYNAYVAALTERGKESASGEQLGAAHLAVEKGLADARTNQEAWSNSVSERFESEARSIALRRGGEAAVWQDQLEKTYATQGIEAFTPRADHVEILSPAAIGVLGALFGVWWISVVLQGGGMSLDSTRRRHPMWEWYLGFPIAQSAVFTAEAIAPIFSNPFMLLSPVLLAAVVGLHQDSFLAGFCALPLAIPLVLSAAVWAKALEVLIMLRCTIRSRGIWLALMAGVGFLALFLPYFLAGAPGFMRDLLKVVYPTVSCLGGTRVLFEFDDLASWLGAAGISLGVGIALAIPAYLAMRFALARGLESGFGSPVSVTSARASSRSSSSGRKSVFSDPLAQKEWLWLERDRGAWVPLVVVPTLLVLFHIFDGRNMLSGVELTWNKVAAVIVGIGVLMLFSAGPRALLSEGQALALTLSWPRSLEDTLRMKARLVFALVSTTVLLCLVILMWMFPHDVVKLLVIVAAWPCLGLSIAEKAITLFRAPSSSGEIEPLAQSQVWAANIGNLTFPIALYTGHWRLAGAAIVLNWILAGAAWEGFRHRLPYLFDAASEPELRPPTILSSLVAIVALMEISLILILLMVRFAGPEAIVFAQAMGYGIAAIAVSIYVLRWHRRCGVGLTEILRFDDSSSLVPLGACVVAAVIGGGLGMVGIGYQNFLLSAPWPELREPLSKTIEFFALYPEMRIAYAIMAVGFAPWVEEFLFRGLMFRAMLPQWGLGASILASSAFFTILHPAMAWPLVFSLGAINAYLFVRTRRLLPCVILHMVYNAVIVGLTGY
jgi:membrane protease YdiL (CAAX protease family)